MPWHPPVAGVVSGRLADAAIEQEGHFGIFQFDAYPLPRNDFRITPIAAAKNDTEPAKADVTEFGPQFQCRRRTIVQVRMFGNPPHAADHLRFGGDPHAEVGAAMERFDFLGSRQQKRLQGGVGVDRQRRIMALMGTVSITLFGPARKATPTGCPVTSSSSIKGFSSDGASTQNPSGSSPRNRDLVIPDDSRRRQGKAAQSFWRSHR